MNDYINRLNFETAQRHYDQQEHPDYWRKEPEEEPEEEDSPEPYDNRYVEGQDWPSTP